MGFDFEKFVEVAASYDAKITVRQKTGQIGFSSGAINLYEIDRYSHAVLFFDRKERVVGIKLTNKQDEAGAIPINRRPSNTYLSARNFLNKYGVDYSRSHRHELNKDESTGMLYFVADREQPQDRGADERQSPEGHEERLDRKQEESEAREEEGQEDPFGII